MNTITANLKTHLYIVAAEWKEPSLAKKSWNLPYQYVKIIFLFLKAPQAFTKSPCCFFKR
jgi:hypothetical protein